MKFPEGTIPCRNYRSYDPSKRSEHLPGVDWNLISNCHEVNLAWRIFKNKLEYEETPIERNANGNAMRSTMIRKAKPDYTRNLLSENSRNPDGFLAAKK